MLQKSPTWIRGFDEISGGGLPAHRPSLVCGGAGCGKTLFGLEFLIRGALRSGEPGVLLSFEERAQDIAANVASLGFDVPDLVKRDLLRIDEVHVDASEIAETGDYDLEGLFIRIGSAIEEIGAQRLVLDTMEALFLGFSDHGILRSELARLFRWLKERGITTVVTAERGDGVLTRHGVEEYVSDCVVMLDHRVQEQVSTRRLRILKYRGSQHGTNEYPFLIGSDGFSILPVTSLGLEHIASEDTVSSGIEGLDRMLDHRGYYRGSSVLISGEAGSGKTSVALSAARAAAIAGERCLVFPFEESPSQIERNMRSIGLDLAPAIDSQRLEIHPSRPTLFGLEHHLVELLSHTERFFPSMVVIDPVSSFLSGGLSGDVLRLLIRLVDEFKARETTLLMTDLTQSDASPATSVGVSSLADVWIMLGLAERAGDYVRTIRVLKARGMSHASRVQRLDISQHGIEVKPPDGR